MRGAPWRPREGGEEWLSGQTALMLDAGIWIPLPIMCALLVLDYPHAVKLTPSEQDPVYRSWGVYGWMCSAQEHIRFDPTSSREGARGILRGASKVLELSLLLEKDIGPARVHARAKKALKVGVANSYDSDLKAMCAVDSPKADSLTVAIRTVFRNSPAEVGASVPGWKPIGTAEAGLVIQDTQRGMWDALRAMKVGLDPALQSAVFGGVLGEHGERAYRSPRGEFYETSAGSLPGDFSRLDPVEIFYLKEYPDLFLHRVATSALSQRWGRTTMPAATSSIALIKIDIYLDDDDFCDLPAGGVTWRAVDVYRAALLYFSALLEAVAGDGGRKTWLSVTVDCPLGVGRVSYDNRKLDQLALIPMSLGESLISSLPAFFGRCLEPVDEGSVLHGMGKAIDYCGHVVMGSSRSPADGGRSAASGASIARALRLSSSGGGLLRYGLTDGDEAPRGGASLRAVDLGEGGKDELQDACEKILGLEQRTRARAVRNLGLGELELW
jgi:hypothetical protein